MNAAAVAASFAVVFFGAGCGSPAHSPGPSSPAPAPAPEAPEAPEAPDDARTSEAPAGASGADQQVTAPPFTAEQIRDATPQGLVTVMRLEVAGQEPVLQRGTFVAVDETRGTYRAEVIDADGNVLEQAGEATETWKEYEGHAVFPRELTTRTETTIDTEMGTFDAWVYEVAPGGAGGPTRRLFFAKTLPGPPVLMEVEQDGVVVMRLVMLSRERS